MSIHDDASAARIPVLVASRRCHSADAIMSYLSEIMDMIFPIVPAVSCAEAQRLYGSSELAPEAGTPCIAVINSPLCDGDGVALARRHFCTAATCGRVRNVVGAVVHACGMPAAFRRR